MRAECAPGRGRGAVVSEMRQSGATALLLYDL